MIHLQGHAALVTGSTKGVGKAIAEAFAAAGASVVIHGRRESPESEEVLANCRAANVTAEFITGDLSGPTETVVEEVFEKAVSVMPDIDILVNNAGTYIDKPYLEMDMETYGTTMRLN
ncbi:MAG: SDR family NAD(P)-dependent oxidoreductase, partial [Fuerstiella sp.]|nr:SDR family NAD(P)-dependent oxidoreductase [Fuerstiella sp.]